MQKIAIIGGGGREHALADALKRDQNVTEIGTFIPNPGIQSIDKARLFQQIEAINPSTFIELGRFLEGEGYDSAIVGPEQPLADGIVDAWREAGINLPIFGPSKEAAQLEASKGFARKFMSDFNIPIPEYHIVNGSESAAAEDYIRTKFREGATKIVLKADGLAGGKGVEIYNDPDLAIAALKEYFSGIKFKEAGQTVVIEECIEGMEFSVFALVDGTGNYKILPAAQDHKRLLEGDKGPNTGGMGAFAPFIHPSIDHARMMKHVEERIIKPTVDGIQSRGLDYRGVIYFGLMQTADGPKVIEYNVRFGDPEAEVLLPLIETPFSHIVRAVTEGRLDELDIDVSNDSMVGVVLAAEGYPNSPKKGAIITGLENAGRVPGVQVFHAGTKEQDEHILVSGGRVLVVTGRGKNIGLAVKTAYEGAMKIQFDGMQIRHDIAHNVLDPK